MTTKPKSITFDGIPSGDGSCFCWAVTAEEFAKVTKRDPTVFELCGSPHFGLFKLYPFEVLDKMDIEQGNPIRFTIEVDELWRETESDDL